jgi:predicted RNase H-like nuclease (RuvC/YqgF family)
MEANETTLEELGQMLTHVVEHMVTKEDLAAVKSELKGDIAALGTQVASIERELKVIRHDLDEIRDKVENVSGFRKEIDHALERIAAIEKDLGIGKKIAA